MKKDKILFLRLRLLGDIIFTIPAVQIYKEYFPDNIVYYVAEENFAPAAALIPGIERVITVPYKMGLKHFLEFRREIKSLGIETVIDFHSGPKSALLTRITGAKKRIGYKTPNRNWAYTHLTPRQHGKPFTHSVYNQARLLEHLGIPIAGNLLPPYPPVLLKPGTGDIQNQQGQRTGINAIINIDNIKNNISPAILAVLAKKNKRLVVHVGAGNRFRDWGSENFAALIKKIKANKNEPIDIFLIGHSEEEREKGRLLAKLPDETGSTVQQTVYDFTGRLAIPETLYLISQSTVYFGVDSGPLHLASLTQTPIVTLFGPNIPAISGPWRQDKVDIIQLELDCRPCSQRTCIYGTIRCMKNITTDKVYEAIDKYLQ